jgi:hypothetical protein
LIEGIALLYGTGSPSTRILTEADSTKHCLKSLTSY